MMIFVICNVFVVVGLILVIYYCVGNFVEVKCLYLMGFYNVDNKVEDYSCLLLRKNMNMCILVKIVIIEDEGYVFL